MRSADYPRPLKFLVSRYFYKVIIMPVPIVPIVVGGVKVSAYLLKTHGKKKAIEVATRTARNAAAKAKPHRDPLTGKTAAQIKRAEDPLKKR